MYKGFNQNMRITVQINDYFNRYGVRSGEIELPAGATVADLLKSLGIPLSEIGFVVRNSTVLKKQNSYEMAT